MFTIYCPRHQARVLIWPSGLDGIVNHDGVIDVHFHCTCGYRGVHRTGRKATEETQEAAACA